MTELRFVGSHIFVKDSDIAAAATAGLNIRQEPTRPAVALRDLTSTEHVATWGHIDRDLAERMTRSGVLRHIVLMSTGYEECITSQAFALLAEREVAVSYTPRYATVDVAEFAIGLLLLCRRRLLCGLQPQTNHPGGTAGDRIAGSRIGVVGLGSIGSRVAEGLQSLGAHVSVSLRPGSEKHGGYSQMDLQSTFRSCHAVILTCPLNDTTRRMITGELLMSMPERGCLINVARPDIVDPDQMRSVFGARSDLQVALDGDREIMTSERWHWSTDFDSVLWTPHMAFNSKEALQACAAVAIGNAIAFERGEPRNTVPNSYRELERKGIG